MNILSANNGEKSIMQNYYYIRSTITRIGLNCSLCRLSFISVRAARNGMGKKRAKTIGQSQIMIDLARRREMGETEGEGACDHQIYCFVFTKTKTTTILANHFFDVRRGTCALTDLMLIANTEKRANTHVRRRSRIRLLVAICVQSRSLQQLHP